MGVRVFVFGLGLGLGFLFLKKRTTQLFAWIFNLTLEGTIAALILFSIDYFLWFVGKITICCLITICMSIVYFLWFVGKIECFVCLITLNPKFICDFFFVLVNIKYVWVYQFWSLFIFIVLVIWHFRFIVLILDILLLLLNLYDHYAVVVFHQV